MIRKHSRSALAVLLAGLSTMPLLLAQTILAQSSLVGNIYVHDPSTMVKQGDRYYLFHTGSGIPGKYSTDLIHWERTPAIFPEGPPAWTTNAVKGFRNRFWAPDIAFVNGKYHLYYSCSTFGKQVSAIGLVTSPSLSSPEWTDQGVVIQSTNGNPFNCIDPGILLDTNGTMWMVFGSYFGGLFLTQLDPLTGRRSSDGSPVIKIADNGATPFHNTSEAPWIYQHAGFYYLFLNFGKCCSGVESTYNIRFGRSTNIAGPYFDQNAVSLLQGGGTLLMQSTNRFIGPGHAGILHDSGTNWFTYHYYDGKENGAAKLGLTQFKWSSSHWPTIESAPNP